MFLPLNSSKAGKESMTIVLIGHLSQVGLKRPKEGSLIGPSYAPKLFTFLHLHLGHLGDAFIQSDLQVSNISTFVVRSATIYRCRYSKDIEPSASTTIARLTNSLCYINDSSYCSCYTVNLLRPNRPPVGDLVSWRYVSTTERHNPLQLSSLQTFYTSLERVESPQFIHTVVFFCKSWAQNHKYWYLPAW